MKGEVKQVNGKRVATPEYRSWQAMKNRVLNINCKDHWRYNSFRIDPRWIESFDSFLQDMGRRPTLKHTLDRLNGDDGYFKYNCVWATRQEQSRNRKNYLKCSAIRAEDIRRLYNTGEYLQRELAVIFGLTQAHISQIVRNACWARD